ncbi:MAG: hypothetical protein QME05_06775 [Candidatus Margulisbacteria bacterium]|nr:hypothetical protein [Candidatus Margulisiibacteriota bacterium]
MGKAIKGLVGVALLALGVCAIYLWRADLLVLIKGGVGLFLILAAMVAFALMAD